MTMIVAGMSVEQQLEYYKAEAVIAWDTCEARRLENIELQKRIDEYRSTIKSLRKGFLSKLKDFLKPTSDNGVPNV